MHAVHSYLSLTYILGFIIIRQMQMQLGLVIF